MAIVKIRIIADRQDNEALIKFLTQLFSIVPDFIEGPLPNKRLTVSFLTFEYSEEKIREILD